MMRGVQGWIIRIGIIALVAGGALIFRDRLSSNAGDLKVGDCFDDPSGTSEINDVQHHPCTESHTAEVVFLGTMDGANTAFPAFASVQAWVASNCLPAWTSYTGKVFETEEILSLGFYQPTAVGWGKGDRQVICYAGRADGAAMTSSVKN